MKANLEPTKPEEGKGFLEQKEELDKAFKELFLIICHELKIDKLVKWLNSILEE